MAQLVQLIDQTDGSSKSFIDLSWDPTKHSLQINGAAGGAPASADRAIVALKKGNNNTASAIDIWGVGAGGEFLQRWYGIGAGVGPVYDGLTDTPNVYMSSGGGLYTRNWITISGTSVSSGENYRIQDGTVDPTMLSIWADVKYSIVSRAGAVADAAHFKGVDRTGALTTVVLGEYGALTLSNPAANLTVVNSGTPVATRGVFVYQNNDGVQASLMNFHKSRGTYATPTAVASGDYGAASFMFHHDGSNYLANSSFGSRVIGAVSPGVVPTEMWFYAGTAGSNDPYALRLLGIISNGTFDQVRTYGNHRATHFLVGKDTLVDSALDIVAPVGEFVATLMTDYAVGDGPTFMRFGSTSGGVAVTGAVGASTGVGLHFRSHTGYSIRFSADDSNFSKDHMDLATDGGLLLKNSTAAAVLAGAGVFRYNTGTNKLQFSNDGGAFADIGTSAGTIGGTFTTRQVGFATALDTIGGSTTFLYSTNLNLVLGTTTDLTTTRLHVVADKTGATGTSWNGVKFGASTYTLTGGVGFTGEIGFVRFSQPTITNADASTVGDSATVIIDDGPLQAGSVTLTRKWALKLNSGAFAIDAPGTLASPGFRFGGLVSDTFGFYKVAGYTYGMSVGGIEYQRMTDTSYTLFHGLDAGLTGGALKTTPGTGTGGSGKVIVNGPGSSDAATTAASFQVYTQNLVSAPTVGFSWRGADFRASTLTFTGTGQASLGSISGVFFGAPTITRDNANTYTTSTATTIWIDGEPTVSGVTATKVYAMFINEGGVRLQSASDKQRVHIVDNNYTTSVDKPSKLVVQGSSFQDSPAATLQWRSADISNNFAFSGTGQTMTLMAQVWLSRPGITKSGGNSFTVTDFANLYIAGAPNPTSVTLTNSYAIFVDQGISRFDGDGSHVFELPADATGNVTAATGRIPVKISGATKYLRYFDD